MADMSPEATFEAFRAALSCGAWDEAAGLVHPAFAKHRQETDLGLFGTYFAATDGGEQERMPEIAHVVVVKERADFSSYFGRRVVAFPGSPTLGELATLTPREYLGCAMAARLTAQSGMQEMPGYLLPVQLLKVTDDGTEAQLDLRLSGLNVEEGTLQVRLRMAGSEWRILPWPEEFMAPTPWEAS